MFGSNAHYGHRNILNRYAGVPLGTPIPGLVEHGWNYDLGAAFDDILLPAPDPFFVWSEPNLRACQEAGLGDRVVPIGAPYLYLPPPDEAVATQPKSLLVMPLHGWEKARLEHDYEAYARSIAEIERNFSSITVCLYFFEHREPRFRKPFESRGYQIVSAGIRDNNPEFLTNLRRILLRHEYVCSNRVQTSTFYALYHHRKTFLHGPQAGVESRIDRTGKLYHAWQAREYPMLMWDQFKDESYPDLAARELGLPHVRTRDELLELFDWTPQQRPKLDAVVHAFKTRQHAQNVESRRERWRSALETIPLYRRLRSR